MGCGRSAPVARSSETAKGNEGRSQARKNSVFQPVPKISVTVGSKVRFHPPPHPKVIFIFGGPGSGKGRIVSNLRSMFGVRLITAEALVLRYLPKKVQHAMTLTSTGEMADLIRKEPSHVTLDWVLRLMQHAVESDPDQVFIVDVVPNLRWLVRNEFLMKESCEELAAFEEKVAVSFAIHLALPEDSLDKTLDYSHHTPTTQNQPPGATVADGADNVRAKRRFMMHEKASAPFLDYFRSSDRLVTVDVSSGAMDPIWEEVHAFCTKLGMHAWRPVDSMLVFAMEGLQVGNLDLGNCDMKVITLRDITTEPQASVETLLEILSEHIDTLADSSHLFVIDPADTTVMTASMSGFHKRSIVFSDVREKSAGCVNKFSKRLNGMVGEATPYFKAVCSSEDETLIFPASTTDEFCQQMALCMAEKHPSKR